jgi:hypothetical protein
MVVWDARSLRGVPRGPLTVSDRPFQLERPHNPCREAVQERVVRQIRMLRAMRRELETGLRRLLNGHAGGNPGHGQGAAYGLPRQFPTLPGLIPTLRIRHPHIAVTEGDIERGASGVLMFETSG